MKEKDKGSVCICVCERKRMELAKFVSSRLEPATILNQERTREVAFTLEDSADRRRENGSDDEEWNEIAIVTRRGEGRGEAAERVAGENNPRGRI